VNNKQKTSSAIVNQQLTS